MTSPDSYSASSSLWDDPERDFRQRYELPIHFLWDPLKPNGIDYAGYVSVALSLLPEPPSHILDVGCGDGWVANKALARGYDVTGIDYNERAVQFAQLIVQEGAFHVGDVRELATSERWLAKFEGALFIEVLEHIPPQYHLQVLQSINHCLKPSGILVMSVPSIHMRVNQWHYKHFTMEEGANLLGEAGFVVNRIMCQHVFSWATSQTLWRAISNRWYDFPFVRSWLRKLILGRYNVTNDPQKAGRYIYQAIKEQAKSGSGF